MLIQRMTEGVSDEQSKKRKHRPAEGSSPQKKEKRPKATVQSAPPAQSPPKPKSPKDKGKSRASDALPSEFRIVSASIVLSIPPVFASNLRAGVEEMLDSMVMRYAPSLHGVLLAHSNIRFLSQTASIHGDCPFVVCNVCFDATVWGPRVAMKLVGRVNVCSPDHVSLLVHRTFNVSIPRHHIPQDQWVFEYGSAENDPEFGEGRVEDTGSEPKGGEGVVEMGDPTELNVSGETQEAESSGRWVHHLTGAKLGDPDGYVEFMVIGLTVANEMLSLQGSIQPDPFSPEHVLHPDKDSAFHQDESPEVGAQDEKAQENEESDEDLAGLTHETQARAKGAKEEAGQLEKAKKRKRQDHRFDPGETSYHGKRALGKKLKETIS